MPIIHKTFFTPPRPATTGLGDVVAKAAQPIARVIDALVGTSIKACGACDRRRRYLNSLVPDINPFHRHGHD